MHVWVVQMEQRGAPMLTEVLLEQAETFGAQLQVPDSFSYSSRWLDSLKKRMGLKAVQQHGEAGSATIASVDLAKTAVPLVIRGYSADDVYNQDETGLFWRQLPTRKIATGSTAGRKRETSCHRIAHVQCQWH